MGRIDEIVHVQEKEGGVKVMWIVNLNSAPKEEDLSHTAYFQWQTAGRDRRLNRDKVEGPGESICVENLGQL